MPMSLTELRANLYKIVDQIIMTGIPVEIQRNGHMLKIISTDENIPSRLNRLQPKTDVIIGDPESLVHSEWLSEWSELPQP